MKIPNKSKNKTAFTLDKIQDNYLISVKILRKEIIQAWKDRKIRDHHGKKMTG